MLIRDFLPPPSWPSGEFVAPLADAIAAARTETEGSLGLPHSLTPEAHKTMDPTIIPHPEISPFPTSSTSTVGAIAPGFDTADSPVSPPTLQSLGDDVDFSFGSSRTLEGQPDPLIGPSVVPSLSLDQTPTGGKQPDLLIGDVSTLVGSGKTAPSVRAESTLASADTTVDPNFFSQFRVADASRDDTVRTVFEDGALRLNYEWSNAPTLNNVRLEAVQGGVVVANLGTWSTQRLSDKIINLADFASIDRGTYKIRAIAQTVDGTTYSSTATRIGVRSWTVKTGNFTADRLNYAGDARTGAIFLGEGGTDSLRLSKLTQEDVISINGMSLATFAPWTNSTTSQAIFQGTAFDYLTLSNGREIYFQGIETLKFSDGSALELQVRPNDTHFNKQWNLRISDVESAWRFTQGSTDILLASIDTGILTAPGAEGGITDISPGRLITDPTDDDNYEDDGHGHNAISVMSSTVNNSSGVAGINWYSSVYVTDVYNGVDLQTAITNTIDYARANNLKVVFQGGIQGDYWLTDGGTRAELEALISNNSDIALFAVAAGNGGPGGGFDDPDYLTSVSGVAKLQTSHANVMSIGALERGEKVYVNGLVNTSTVKIAGYSNRGSNLTLMAATDSPAMNKFGDMDYFSGTSCANPNMAAIASLVWSVNPSLDAGQVRKLLVSTAMDLGDKGRDNTFGHGLVNAEAAVRRAWALREDRKLATVYNGKQW